MLLNLNPVKNASDLKALRYLYDSCEIQIHSLASMGVFSDTWQFTVPHIDETYTGGDDSRV